MDRHVFISYRRSDSRAVDELLAALSRQFTFWRDTARIAGGQVWREEITRALDAAYAMILVASTDTEQSKEVYAEYFYALGRKVPIIPLLITQCELPFGLENVNARVWYKDKQLAIEKLRGDLARYDRQTPALESAKDVQTYLGALQLGYLMTVGNYTPMAGEGRFRHEVSYKAVNAVVMRPEFSLRRKSSLYADHRIEETKRDYEDLLPALHATKRVVVLGEPGIGKTTTLYKFADELRQRTLEKLNAPIPLIIPLREWRGDVTWEALIARHLGVLAPRYEELLENRGLFLLLDGLNELPRGETREEKLESIRRLLGEQVPTVVTCRELDYRDEGLKLDLDTITIHPLDPARILDFLRRYLIDDRGASDGIYLATNLFWEISGGAHVKFVWEKWHQTGKALNLFFHAPEIPDDVLDVTSETDDQIWWEVVQSRSNLLRLAANPYLLWMFLQIYLEIGKIPPNRGALFDEFVFQLLKREGFSDGDRLSVEGQGLISRLEELAWTMQRRALQSAETGGGVELTVARNDAISILCGEEELYRAASTNLVEDTEPVRFTHQLLQEYFVGRRMLAESNAGRLNMHDFWPKDRWWEPSGWEEAAVLAVGMSGVQAKREILERLLLANPEVAALAIARSGFEFDDQLKTMLREILLPQLVDLEQHPDAGARAAIGRALGIVTFTNGEPLDNRPGVGLTKDGFPDIEWVDVPGGAITLEDVEGKFEVKPFRLARYVVTNRQFEAFINTRDGFSNKKWWTQIEQSPAPPLSERTEANTPRENVSWYDAVAFCRWLSEKYRERGLLAKGQVIRLPTEWEWHQAATKGNSYNIYPWGLKWDSTRCNSNESDLGRTSTVGLYPNGTWVGGPLDIAGNVWEWCLNKCEHPRSPDATKIDRSGQRVIRGGSWYNEPGNLRSSHRYGSDADFRAGSIGFRLAQDMP